MAGKRAVVDERQITWTWTDPEELLEREAERGPVVFEAADASKIVTTRPPKLPRVRQKKGQAGPEPPSMGLPFGAREHEGRVVCWSCAQSLSDAEVVTAGPGMRVCPGCGARLPFA
jgi:hypothetical protein